MCVVQPTYCHCACPSGAGQARAGPTMCIFCSRTAWCALAVRKAWPQAPRQRGEGPGVAAHRPKAATAHHRPKAGLATAATARPKAATAQHQPKAGLATAATARPKAAPAQHQPKAGLCSVRCGSGADGMVLLQPVICTVWQRCLWDGVAATSDLHGVAVALSGWCSGRVWRHC